MNFMICKFCKKKEADKKNTHYLTDAIIRRCLNLDGVNERGKGLYYTFDSNSLFIEPKFQQIDAETLIEKLDRKPTEEEIEYAKNNNPCSVDYIFCGECEKKFTEIETEFIQKILPKFRKENLTGKENICISENILCRNFFYLQIFRTAVCDNKLYQLPPDFIEKLRIILFNKEEDTSIPLSIIYLQTMGGQEFYTENFAGSVSGQNPYIIFMNDFVIQHYDSEDNITFDEFCGLNTETDYKTYINIDEKEFVYKVISNKERKELLYNILLKYKAKPNIKQYEEVFKQTFMFLFRRLPSREELISFYKGFLKHMEYNKTPLSEQAMLGFMKSYFLVNFNEPCLNLNTGVFYFLQGLDLNTAVFYYNHR